MTTVQDGVALLQSNPFGEQIVSEQRGPWRI